MDQAGIETQSAAFSDAICHQWKVGIEIATITIYSRYGTLN